jgi:prepilin-type N-terminal cleavage/methylation domain-containing protein
MLAFNYLKSAIRRQGRPLSAAPEQGLTLIECIAAIAVIGITAALISPPLFIAAATRVQNRRAEQALGLAQGEVDRIQVLMETGEHNVSVLPDISGSDDLEATPAPSGLHGAMDSVNPTYNAYGDEQVALGNLRQIDTDGDGETDFLMQVFRTRGRFSAEESVAPDPRPSEFELGVRVYSFQAADNLGSLGTEPASLTLTSGTGNQNTNPLAVLITNVNWSQESFSSCIYHGRDESNCSN